MYKYQDTDHLKIKIFLVFFLFYLDLSFDFSFFYLIFLHFCFDQPHSLLLRLVSRREPSASCGSIAVF